MATVRCKWQKERDLQAIHLGIPKNQKPASGAVTVVAVEAAVAVLAALMQEATYLIAMGLETICLLYTSRCV